MIVNRRKLKARDEAARSVSKGSGLAVPSGARCSRCQKPLKPDASGGWCSSDCRQAEVEDVSQAKLRALVLERDRGVCSACGLDCLVLRAELDALRAAVDVGGYHEVKRWLARVHQLMRLGFDKHAVESGAALWECDHVVEKARGGPSTLEACTTRCLPCHKAKTSSFSTSRAQARNPRMRFGR